jgi:hypothetical protein
MQAKAYLSFISELIMDEHREAPVRLDYFRSVKRLKPSQPR